MVGKKLSKQLSAEHDSKRPEMQGTRTLSEWAAQEAAKIRVLDELDGERRDAVVVCGGCAQDGWDSRINWKAMVGD